MEIIAVGLNHKTASVELREKLAFSKGRLAQAYSTLQNFSSIQEGLILSTCNRVEIYCVVDDAGEGISSLKEFLSIYHGVSLGHFERNLYIYLGPESIRHLFDVASGLDSMVIGETQILGQLKQAYFNACRNGSVGKVLEVLLQRAFRTSKEVRSSTNVGRGAVSVSSVAVKLAEEILGSLWGRKVMVIGAGKMSELAVKYLVSKGAGTVLVSNRTFQRATELAGRFGGQAIRFDELSKFIVEADIVISSTSAPHLILRKEQVLAVSKQRKGRPLFLIDLAVPRDIEPEAGDVEGVHLYDIDDLKGIAQENVRLRHRELDSCRRIVQGKVDKFMAWFVSQKEEMVAFCG